MNYFTGIFVFVIGLAAIYAGRKVNRVDRKIKKFQKAAIDTLIISIIDPKQYHRLRNPKALDSSYTFKVNGKLYNGNMTHDINFTGAEKGFYPKYALIEKAEIESANIVWYNPEDPSENFLKKTNLFVFNILPIVGYLMCFCSLIYLLSLI